ncbi:acylphosphatase [Sporolactobacillus sp. STCC-11]|uniref:acylphosphatase n=1 Tax=Sporolactobacillus caesalpiniae TaxID=3230362 RepID=UPI003397215C
MVKENDAMKSVHLIVSGRVQGVGFRYFIKQIAAQHYIKGWIRNRDDGRVEIAAEGTAQQVDSFIRKIRRGTFLARVEDIEIHMCAPQNYTAFDEKATV